jgi:monofunctional biosynthetic peptidoglycan transglycosylase
VASRKKINFRRAAQILFVAIVVILLIPPAQVALAILWDPPIVPKRIQRKFEAWRKGKPMKGVPSRWVALKDIPEGFIHLVWASEDQQFFDHHGFDVPRLREALEEAQEGNGEPRGVSTITMQCARSVFLWQGDHISQSASRHTTRLDGALVEQAAHPGTLPQSH